MTGSNFFTADLHFGHENIIKYCDRPFENAREMDETIIRNWNKTVGEKDTVYFLGDFSFKDARTYVDRLNGLIVMVWGNHDKPARLVRNKFSAWYDLLSTKICGVDITMCHYAMRVWDKSHFNSWQLYGHSHGTLPPEGKQYDVGVDNNDFKPLSFDQLKGIMAKLPNNINYLEKTAAPDFKRGK